MFHVDAVDENNCSAAENIIGSPLSIADIAKLSMAAPRPAGKLSQSDPLPLRQRLDPRFNNHVFLGTFGAYALPPQATQALRLAAFQKLGKQLAAGDIQTEGLCAARDAIVREHRAGVKKTGAVGGAQRRREEAASAVRAWPLGPSVRAGGRPTAPAAGGAGGARRGAEGASRRRYSRRSRRRCSL